MKSSHHPKPSIVLDDVCHGLAFLKSICMKIPLAILAGGQGSRMGHPKGELRIGGTPILQYLLEQCSWPGPTLLVTAPGRQHPPGWESFDREAVDPVAGEGPLRGIVTALENFSDAESIVVTTCDMPRVTRQMLDHLLTRLAGDPTALGMMIQRADIIEPFPFTLRTTSLDLLRERLNQRARSLHSLAKLPQFRLIAPPPDWDERVWTNLNAPEDYRRFTEADA